MVDFSTADHTIVLSDIHLTESEPPNKPMWKVYKRVEHFVDARFEQFLDALAAEVEGRIELVLNGDVFDFDSVMTVPVDDPQIKPNFFERTFGLNAEEPRSAFKMRAILHEHPVFCDALARFIERGHRVVFVIGNHDVELQWQAVQEVLLAAIAPSEAARAQVRFCEWFYLSNGDTLIEHGNQHDEFCLALNPLSPTIQIGKHPRMRVPFGNLAERYMMNRMGLMNPHVDSSFIKASIWDYLVFFYRHVMRVQPFLFFAWLVGACCTLVHALSEGLLPAKRDARGMRQRVDDVARKANVTSDVVWALKELHAHPAIFRPWKVAQELWLDRVIVLGAVLFMSFETFSVATAVQASASSAWFLGPCLMLMPLFVFYARGVQPQVERALRAARQSVPETARTVGVQRIVHGHTHVEQHTFIEGVEYLNTGTWSSAFHDAACTQPFGQKCFAWIRPGPAGRQAALHVWHQEELQPQEAREPSVSPVRAAASRFRKLITAT